MKNKLFFILCFLLITCSKRGPVHGQKGMVVSTSRQASQVGIDILDKGGNAVDAAVAEVLAERADFVAERGMGALGPLMGVVMGKLGGAADGKAVSAALKEQIQKDHSMPAETQKLIAYGKLLED